MQATSMIFFGMLLIPLIIFLFWVIKQDKKRNYLGLLLLLIGAIIAIYTVIKLDENFMKQARDPNIPKGSSFR